MVAQWEDRFYKSLRGHTFIGDANFAEVAHAFGIKSESISDPKDVIPALKRMLKHKGPYVLDVKYPYNDKSNGHVMPMIPGNHTFWIPVWTHPPRSGIIGKRKACSKSDRTLVCRFTLHVDQPLCPTIKMKR